MTVISVIMIITLIYGKSDNLINFFVLNLLIPSLGFIILLVLFYWWIIVFSLNKFYEYSKTAENDNSNKILKILIPIIIIGIIAYIIEIVISLFSLSKFSEIKLDMNLIPIVIVTVLCAILWNFSAYFRIKRAGWNQFFKDAPDTDTLYATAIHDFSWQIILTIAGLIITIGSASFVFGVMCWNLNLEIDSIAIYGGIFALLVIYIKMLIENNKKFPEIYPDIEYLFPRQDGNNH